MPQTARKVYEVQAPDGRTFEVEGDRPPTPAELQQIFSGMGQTPKAEESDYSFGEAFKRGLLGSEGRRSAQSVALPIAMSAGAGALPAGAARLLASPKAWGAGRAVVGLATGESVPEALYEGLEQAGATKLATMAPGASRMLSKRLLDWINRGRSASAAGPATVARFPANPEEAVAAIRLPAGKPQWHGPRTPPELLHQAAQAKAAEAAAATKPTVPKRAPKVAVAEPDSSTLEQQLQQSVKLSKGARKQLGNAQALEAKIVDWKTRQGLSEPQIVNALKESQGFVNEPGMAREVVDMVLRAHGLKR